MMSFISETIGYFQVSENASRVLLNLTKIDLRLVKYLFQMEIQIRHIGNHPPFDIPCLTSILHVQLNGRRMLN